MKKKIKLFCRRFLVFICVLSFSFSVFPYANAASDSSFVDILALNSVDYNFKDFGTYLTFDLEGFPYYTGDFVLDIFSLKEPTSWELHPFSASSSELINLGNNFYRIIYHNCFSNHNIKGKLIFRFSSYNTLFTVISANFYSSTISSIPAQVYYKNAGDGFDFIDDSGSVSSKSNESGTYDGLNTFNFVAAPNYTGFYNHEFDITLYISPNDWKKFDQIYFTSQFFSNSITSVSCRAGDIVLPIEVSFYENFIYSDPLIGESDTNIIDSSGVAAKRLFCSIDISSLTQYDQFICLQFSGSYTDGFNVYGGKSFGFIQSICGLTVPDVLDTDIVWYRRIYQQLLRLINGDGSGSAALQTQQQVNTQVNNEIVSAVNDWNTQIDVVQTGYDNAIDNVTPGLHWLANLADGVFSGMGWFGNVYFLVGLVSVFMLILSKSGLAHKISNFYTRRD